MTEIAPRKGEAATLVLFLTLIFIGDVFLARVTLPICLLLLPVLLWMRPPGSSARVRDVPAGLWWLGGLLVVVAVQFFVYRGDGLSPRVDLGTWRPALQAIVVLACLRAASLPDHKIGTAFFAGGAITGALMIAISQFASPLWHPVPGQDRFAVKKNFNLASKPVGDEADNTAVGSAKYDFAVHGSGNTEYYAFKNTMRSPLGRSNYLAAFFVFLFTIAIFHRPWWALPFAILAVLTLSRFGMVFLVLACLLRGLTACRWNMVRVAWLLPALMLAATCSLIAVLATGNLPESWRIAGSWESRLRYYQSALDVIHLHPLLGSPRSIWMTRLGLEVTWHPHHSVLWMLANFGLVGLVCYAGYVATAFGAIARRAAGSSLWLGVLSGLSLLICWSMVETITMTPAFEVLLATLYALARNELSAAPDEVEPLVVPVGV